MERALEQKKGIQSWFGARIRRFGAKNKSTPSQKLGTARAKCGTAVPPLRISLAAFASCASYSIFSLGPQFLVEHSSIIVA